MIKNVSQSILRNNGAVGDVTTSGAALDGGAPLGTVGGDVEDACVLAGAGFDFPLFISSVVLSVPKGSGH